MFCLSASLVGICDTDILPSVLLCASVYVCACMHACVRVWAAGDRDQHRPFLPASCLSQCVCVCLWVCACMRACLHAHVYARAHACMFFFSSFCCVHLCLIVPAVSVMCFSLFSLCAFVLNCTSCLLLFWFFATSNHCETCQPELPTRPHASSPTT